MFVITGIMRQYRKARLLAKRLAGDIGGFAAVEFAMIAPVMIVMLLGVVEVSDASTVSVRVIDISGAVADMVARCTNGISTKDLNDVFRISDALMGRYSRMPLYIEVIEVKSDVNGVLTVGWSYDKNHASPLAAGSPYNKLPVGLLTPNGSIIVAVAKYKYRSPVGRYIHGVMTLQHTSYNLPRGSQAVNLGATKCNAKV